MKHADKTKKLTEQWQASGLSDGNAAYLEDLYEQYLADPTSLNPAWRDYFIELEGTKSGNSACSHKAIQQEFRQLAHQTGMRRISPLPSSSNDKQVSVLQLINAYRFLGHLKANTDPLGRRQQDGASELTLEHHNLDSSDLGEQFNTGSLAGPDTASLADIIETLNNTYCNSIGAEYMHLIHTEEKRWLQERLEQTAGHFDFPSETKTTLLYQLVAAETLEQYLHTRYLGQKRFSLEGGECLIPILKELIKRGGGQHGVREIAIGMAHRGRLNVLVNIMGKMPSDLFMEFEGTVEKKLGTGDVKYHMGYSADFSTERDPVHVSLAFNPSHLEIVAPVVEGSVRARQDRRQDKHGAEVIPVIIHGDAAFAAQGVVMETFNMSQSRGYSTKGTVHIVINNQIGFTSSKQEDARSTLYCTDVAKMVSAPIFHVNGNDPEAVLFITRLALDYRMQFNKDVVIDMVCYRRHGHSEADEPMATQPMMYKTIRSMDTTVKMYARQLEQEQLIDQNKLEALAQNYRTRLDSGNTVVDEFIPTDKARFEFLPDWEPYKKGNFRKHVDTAITQQRLTTLHHEIQHLPEDFTLHPNVNRILTARSKMAEGTQAIDWGFAETLAYASLLQEGFSIRLSGQDSGRGTFFHRHAVLHDQLSGEAYVPLRNMPSSKGDFLVINSLLSEEAVLAFEYGYATTNPLTLTIWEAQFGDFANNAQVVIDQFISAGEQKWNRLCGLVMLLPHGFEGQGPEHSSARLERYLQLCAQHNMQICVPTNSAQIFHLLRRQMLMASRKPLIVMSPKSLLRHPTAVSNLEHLTQGRFQPVIGEAKTDKDDNISRLVMCSGKVYYDLLQRREELELEHVAIMRIEQLYPFPEEEARNEIQRYRNLKDYVWCQEEPLNQGAWYSSQHHLRTVIGNQNHLHYAGRPLLAAPAVGYSVLHEEQRQQLVEHALGLSDHCKT